MARRRTTVIEQPTPVLDELGLEKGLDIKFRRTPEEHWTKGVLRGDFKDGSLTIVDEHGRWRSMMPHQVMVKRRGPRGGVSWEPVVK